MIFECRLVGNASILFENGMWTFFAVRLRTWIFRIQSGMQGGINLRVRRRPPGKYGMNISTQGLEACNMKSDGARWRR